MEKPLFIPLMAQYYDRFIDGSKVFEYRLHGARWNEKTCYQGRRVVISKGYGTHRRAMGFIDDVMIQYMHTLHPKVRLSMQELYGSKVNEKTVVICIRIRDLHEMVAPDSRDCR